jgi:L-aminopeptidase/D-esterase-like protein
MANRKDAQAILVVGALSVVNAAGSAVMGGGPWFWAAPFEQDGEFGGRGLPTPLPPQALAFRTKGGRRESTTLCVVATDAALTKTQAKRLAVMAQSGLSRAIYPVHTPLDGDILFAAATGRKPLADPLRALSGLGMIMQELGDDKHALDAFRRAIAVHPHLERIPELVKKLTETVEGRAI